MNFIYNNYVFKTEMIMWIKTLSICHWFQNILRYDAEFHSF